MKNKLLTFGLTMVLSLGMTMTAFAADPTVEFTSKNTLDLSNVESGNVLGDTFSDIAPGETKSQSITIKNSNSHTADFYVNAEAIKALEDQANASGGAYSVKLTLTPATGSAVDLYDSTVGGSKTTDNGVAASRDGLKAVNEALADDENAIYLVTLANGETATLTLTMGLDGRSVTNAYWNTDGQVGLTFQVAYDELNPTVITKVVPRTGARRYNVVQTTRDVVQLVQTGDPTAIGVLVAILLAGVAVFVLAGRKKKVEE